MAQSPRSPIPLLVRQNRLRRFAIKCQQQHDRSIEQLIAGYLNYNTDADEDTRKAIFAKAKNVRISVEKTGSFPAAIDVPADVKMQLLMMILNNMKSRGGFDASRASAEKAMIYLAQYLPEHPWQMTVKGFGDLGLAILAAEAARQDYISFGQYRTVSGLWKRMGLAVIDGERQQRVGGTRETDEERLKLAYVPKRRAAGWTLSDSLLRAQMCSELRACREAIAAHPPAAIACANRNIEVHTEKKVERLQAICAEFGLPAEGRPTGPYGEVYVRRKRHTFPRIEATADLPDEDDMRWTPLRCHRDGMRVMFKELLKDLWCESRRHQPSIAPSQNS
jgi:hypothetical protein